MRKSREPNIQVSGDINVEYIGEPREADILYACITKRLGLMAMGRLGAERQLHDCPLPGTFGVTVTPWHPQTLGAQWSSAEKIPGTDMPITVVQQENDPDVRKEWTILRQAGPLRGGRLTIDRYILFPSRIQVERHPINEMGEPSGGIIEMGDVYNLSSNVADMRRLRVLDAALPHPRDAHH